MNKLTAMRQEYSGAELREEMMEQNPIDQFHHWFNLASTSNISEPNAMLLATSSADGKPSARVVLLKEVNERGFVFFTNYQSRKGQELLSNPHAALVFDWHMIGLQVRIEGSVEKIPDNESDEYFLSRPLQSQLGAWISPQSQVINGREELEHLKAQYEETFVTTPPTRPPHWGGLIVIPSSIEFWLGREGRLHDRILYRKIDSNWTLQRLAP